MLHVIAGIFDGVKATNKDSRLYGFILGPGGLIDHKYMELTADIIDEYRNTGGFDMIGSGRTKLETKEQFDKGLDYGFYSTFQCSGYLRLVSCSCNL